MPRQRSSPAEIVPLMHSMTARPLAFTAPSPATSSSATAAEFFNRPLYAPLLHHPDRRLPRRRSDLPEFFPSTSPATAAISNSASSRLARQTPAAPASKWPQSREVPSPATARPHDL